ncbi:MAG: DUF4372 domain-containing protein [Prevotella sp.]|nr:DUF4372 domain-containing protein [Prevotella sp.]MBR6939048.1 DUF4372 domain-containing protein [Prevotella sp.]
MKHYVKRFEAWQHLIMLYAIIKHFDTICEISTFMFHEAHKLLHLGVRFMRMCQNANIILKILQFETF